MDGEQAQMVGVEAPIVRVEATMPLLAPGQVEPFPRVAADVLGRTDAAQKLADLPAAERKRIQQAAYRSLPFLPDWAVQQHASASKDRSGTKQLGFLKLWARGEIPNVDVVASQQVVATTSQSDYTEHRRLNLEELEMLLNAGGDKKLLRYCERLWNATPLPERKHPVPGMPRQRRVYVASVERAGSDRKEETGAKLPLPATGVVAPSRAGVVAPTAALAESAEQEEEGSEPPNRLELHGRVTSALVKLACFRDRLPAAGEDAWKDALRSKCVVHEEELKRHGEAALAPGAVTPAMALQAKVAAKVALAWLAAAQKTLV